MCTPLTIVAAALSAGSLFANAQAARQQQRARNNAMNAENIRQRNLDREISGVVDVARGQYDDATFDQAQGDQEAEIAQFFNDVATGALPAAPPQVSDEATNQAVRRESDRARQFNTQQNNALAGLRGFGDLFAETSRGTARSASEAGILSGFKQGSASVLPLELEAANQKGSGWSMLGDLLNLGSGATMFAGLNAGGAGSAPGVLSAPAQGIGATRTASTPTQIATNPWLQQYLRGG